MRSAPSQKKIYQLLCNQDKLLFYDKKPWVKKTETENFDVPMGCYDGAEVCGLVGCYILNQISTAI